MPVLVNTGRARYNYYYDNCYAALQVVTVRRMVQVAIETQSVPRPSVLRGVAASRVSMATEKFA